MATALRLAITLLAALGLARSAHGQFSGVPPPSSCHALLGDSVELTIPPQR